MALKLEANEVVCSLGNGRVAVGFVGEHWGDGSVSILGDHAARRWIERAIDQGRMGELDEDGFLTFNPDTRFFDLSY